MSSQTQAVALILGLAVLLAGVFAVVWLRDARRSDAVEDDPERLDTATGERTGSGHKIPGDTDERR